MSDSSLALFILMFLVSVSVASSFILFDNSFDSGSSSSIKRLIANTRIISLSRKTTTSAAIANDDDDENNNNNNEEVVKQIKKYAIRDDKHTRRSFFASSLAGSFTSMITTKSQSAMALDKSSSSTNPYIDLDLISTQSETIITQIPIKFVKELQAYLVFYNVGDDKFGAIVDTGSPFLTVPKYCAGNGKWGCFNATNSIERIDLPPTIESFENNQGKVEWRQSTFEFVNARTYKLLPSTSPSISTTLSSLRRPSLLSTSANIVSPFSFVSTTSTTKNRIDPDQMSIMEKLLIYEIEKEYKQQQPLPIPIDENDESQKQSSMVFGLLSNSLLAGTGGVFFGLIRDTDDWIRPSFLGQMKPRIQSFSIDLRDRPYIPDEVTKDQEDIRTATTGKETSTASAAAAAAKTLVLSSGSAQESLLDDNGFNIRTGMSRPYIPLVKDLNIKFGDPSMHYTAKATSIYVNGHKLVSQDKNKPIYVIFDTGVTGFVVSQDLYQQRYSIARKNREKKLWKNVQISFMAGTSRGKSQPALLEWPWSTFAANAASIPSSSYSSSAISVFAKEPLTTPINDIPWRNKKNGWLFQERASLVVVGLAFLEGHKLTIDIDEQKLWLED